MADSPSNLIAELLGETFIDAVERSQNRTVDRLRWLWRWLTDIGEPPHGSRLVTSGTVHTGVALIEHNRVVLLIGFRHSSRDDDQRSHHRPPYHMHDDPRQQWLDEEWPGYPPGHYPQYR